MPPTKPADSTALARPLPSQRALVEASLLRCDRNDVPTHRRRP
jgi:hypothetical protein